MSGIDKPRRMRELFAQPGIIVCPGVYDGLTVKLVEQAGFDIAVVSGAAVSASLLGAPDLGVMSMTELLQQVRNIVDASDIPIIADAETGFGGVQNVVRTVRALEKAGVAAYILEDQTQNRKCGHFADKSVIPTSEMVLKLKAAVRTRENPDVVLIARTDALEIEGIDAAIARARAYAEAGADCLFVEAPRTPEHMEYIISSLKDTGLPLKANMAEGGLTPMYSAAELEKIGFKLVTYPGGTQKVVVKMVSAFLRSLKETGSIDEFYPSKMAALAERSAVLGLSDYLQFETDLLAESS
jgi:2-methylisocitrate lyase-like PEP mutase family enzyme